LSNGNFSRNEETTASCYQNVATALLVTYLLTLIKAAKAAVQTTDKEAGAGTCKFVRHLHAFGCLCEIIKPEQLWGVFKRYFPRCPSWLHTF